MLAVGGGLREAEAALAFGGRAGMPTAIPVVSIAECAAQKRLFAPDGGGQRDGEIQRDQAGDRRSCST